MQVLAPSDDAMRLIPCQLVDEGRGSSLQVTVSGRLSRVQRRDDVRARVRSAAGQRCAPRPGGQADGPARPRTGGPERRRHSRAGRRADRGRRADPAGPAPGQRAAADPGRRCPDRRPACPGAILADAGGASGDGSFSSSTARSSPSASAPRPPPPPTDCRHACSSSPPTYDMARDLPILSRSAAAPSDPSVQ